MSVTKFNHHVQTISRLTHSPLQSQPNTWILLRLSVSRPGLSISSLCSYQGSFNRQAAVQEIILSIANSSRQSPVGTGLELDAWEIRHSILISESTGHTALSITPHFSSSSEARRGSSNYASCTARCFLFYKPLQERGMTPAGCINP